MTLVIMAAGMGSRYGGLKQIEPVGPKGEFIIDYSLYDAIKAGFDKVVFIIKEENYDLFRETVGKRIESKIKVEYAFQRNEDIPIKIDVLREKPWGTGHAILAAKNCVNDNFAIINADDFYGRECYEEMASFLTTAKGNQYAIIGYQISKTINNSNSVIRGVCGSDNGYLSSITESVVEIVNGKYIASPLDGSDSFEVQADSPVSMNAMCFTQNLFDYLEKGFEEFLKQNIDILKREYLIPNVVKELLKDKKGSVKLIDTKAVWHGITYKEDVPLLIDAINEYIKKGQYPENLWQ